MASGLAADTPAEGVRRLLLDRSDRRNALDSELASQLMAALTDASQDSEVRALVVASADPSVFCAGADLSIPDSERAALSDHLYEIYERMVTMTVPVVAVIEGPAVGGGAQLALASDLRLGGPRARFRFPGAGHGLAVGMWGLPGLVGRGHALEYCLTMRWVDAAEAATSGLLTRLVDEPASAAVELAASLVALDTEAVARVKRLAIEPDVRTALRQERDGNAGWQGSTKGFTR